MMTDDVPTCNSRLDRRSPWSDGAIASASYCGGTQRALLFRTASLKAMVRERGGKRRLFRMALRRAFDRFFNGSYHRRPDGSASHPGTRRSDEAAGTSASTLQSHPFRRGITYSVSAEYETGWFRYGPAKTTPTGSSPASTWRLGPGYKDIPVLVGGWVTLGPNTMTPWLCQAPEGQKLIVGPWIHGLTDPHGQVDRRLRHRWSRLPPLVRSLLASPAASSSRRR
jgi:predicted acyl esterase